MKKVLTIMVCTTMLLTSCYDAGQGALTGAHFGSMIGGIVGGLHGGYYGRDMGTLVGMATGAATGAVVGHANSESRKERVESYHRNRTRHTYAPSRETVTVDESGFDESNSGNDVIDFAPSTAEDREAYGTAVPELSVTNVFFNDEGKDLTLTRKEKGEISFELTNTTGRPIHDIMPVISESNGNKHILISPSAKIETIAPGRTIRYTAMVIGDMSLKPGTANFCITVYAGNSQVGDPVTFDIKTAK